MVALRTSTLVSGSSCAIDRSAAVDEPDLPRESTPSTSITLVSPGWMKPLSHCQVLSDRLRDPVRPDDVQIEMYLDMNE